MRLFPLALACLVCTGCSSTLSALGLGAIEVYRAVIRPTHPARCQFHPTCSEYGAQALRELGPIAGTAALSERVQRCHPFTAGDYPLTPDGALSDPLRVAVEPGEAPPRPLFALALRPGEEEQLAFARGLDEAGHHDRAATEWLRFIALFPDSARVDWARLRAGLALAAAGEAAEAEAALAEIPPGGSWFRARLYISQLADLAGDHARAREIRAGLLEVAGDAEEQRAVELIDALAAARSGADALAVARLEAAAAGAPALLAHRDALLALEHKSVALAVGLSAVLPGAGQLYAGRTADGIATFVVNTLVIGGAVVALVFEEPVTAAVLGVLGLVFYSGNLYGAARAVLVADEQAREELTARTRDALFEEGWLDPSWSLGGGP